MTEREGLGVKELVASSSIKDGEMSGGKYKAEFLMRPSHLLTLNLTGSSYEEELLKKQVTE